ncbi:MAG: magnesium transporter CorA family protein [Candidatus Dormibacteria bacterium]
MRLDGARVARPAPADVNRAVAPQLYWVDAVLPDEDELAWLQKAFQLHSLEVDDLRGRNERPKVDDYGAHLFVVLLGVSRDEADASLHLSEVHIVVAGGGVLTVRDGPLPAVEALAANCDSRPELGQGAPGLLFYRLCDATIDSFFPVLDGLDGIIDELETAIVQEAGRDTVADIFRLRRELSVLRRVLGPERDLMQALAGPHGPQLDGETKLYMRDVYDHTVRITEQVDAYRDIVTGALDVYLSSVNNRVTEQTKRLSVVATIFLPLTFLTGFFGMNFRLLVDVISHDSVFWFALLVMLASVPTGYLASRRLSSTSKALPNAERTSDLRLSGRRTLRHNGPARDPEVVAGPRSDPE